MCEKCDNIDAEIWHMQRMRIAAIRMQDARAAHDLIDEMEARKKALQPTQKITAARHL
ncbi:hypothetical protein BraRD5C2_35990 [Bradyrhizobium sp. RD5-C2]|nr:hypothetical protein BraRD5C2_35990 [Bradyrhizobium sp. RD5-C2]